MGTRILNNNVELIGTIISDPEYNHEVMGEKFYKVLLEVKRLSDTADTIPLIIPERLSVKDVLCIGTTVSVRGQFRSRNVHEETKTYLALFVFVQEIQKIDCSTHKGLNQIEFDGFICREPTYRTTPLGREIADTLIAVNRGYGKADYLPCICWGRNARYVSELPIGAHMALTGRIQSRNYTKRYPDGLEEKRTAYEVSVSRIEELDGKE